MSELYEVKPGMIAFGSCLGETQVDRQVFQIDDNFIHYCQTKLLARAKKMVL
ncbi:hypothetical protein [Nostoc sp. 'Lobaria pulmonaria (5183) cyanobiont']|uniref:hypothetical protein n=1 Tax=Nostoc sp. 'Lobaria pulmonaria (5183) cyanobiont' TaxID=1618022 RepID=UPI00131A2B33|nr:hypothetical protein [Nostoc sp. 'Lobaria pulmonaria (5183) cyanobiont']